MRRNAFMFAALIASIAVVGAGSAGASETASPAAAALPASPVPDGAKITKSRSNIQNNREAAPSVKPADAPVDSKRLEKLKTKSNQSND